MTCVYRLVGSLFLLVGFVGQSLFIHGAVRRRDKKRKATVHLVSRYCRRLLALLNVRIREEHHHEHRHPASPVILVSNHVSFLDVFILAARFPAVFVTSTELRDAFLLGWVSRLSGCLFVDRRNPRKLHQEMADIAGVLDDRVSVTFFPESTSSNGEKLLPFRPALFTVPLTTGVPILPAVLNYKAVNEVFDPTSLKRNVFYFGDQNFFVQLWRVLNTRSIDMAVSFLPLEPFSGNPAEKATRRDRARSLHGRMSSAYRPLTETGEPNLPYPVLNESEN